MIVRSPKKDNRKEDKQRTSDSKKKGVKNRTKKWKKVKKPKISGRDTLETRGMQVMIRR